MEVRRLTPPHLDVCQRSARRIHWAEHCLVPNTLDDYVSPVLREGDGHQRAASGRSLLPAPINRATPVDL